MEASGIRETIVSRKPWHIRITRNKSYAVLYYYEVYKVEGLIRYCLKPRKWFGKRPRWKEPRMKPGDIQHDLPWDFWWTSRSWKGQ